MHGERSAAAAALARLLSQIPPRPEARSTLDEYLDWWLHAAVEGRLRAKTARDYRTLLSLYVRPALGENRLDRLQPLDLKSLVSASRRAGIRRAPCAKPTPFSAARSTGVALEASHHDSGRRHAAGPLRQTRIAGL